MNIRELFESAALDSFGLLNDAEVRHFEEALQSASPHLRAQVRALQDRMTLMNDTLPDVSPGPELRRRVLAAVEADVAAQQFAAKEVVGRIEPARTGVSSLWRTVAVGSIAAALVFAVTTIRMRADFAELDGAVRTDQVQALMGSYGAQFERALLNPQTVAYQFVPGTPVLDGKLPPRALMLHEPKALTAHLLLRDLPAGTSSVKVAIADPSGVPGKVIGTFSVGRQHALVLKDVAFDRETSLLVFSGDEPSGLPLLKSGHNGAVTLAEVVHDFTRN